MTVEKRPVGRPTKYNDKILEIAQDYLDNFKDYGDVVPMVASLALELDVSRETVYAWCKDEEKRQFSDIVKKIDEAQHKALVNGSLAGGFNPTIAKLMLSSQHGYTEKQAIEQTVEHSGSVTVTSEEAKQISKALDDEC